MIFDFQPITTDNIIAFLSIILSTALIVLGWIYNAKKTRDFEIFKRRLDKHTEALESAIPLILKIGNSGDLNFPEALEMLRKSRSLFQLYCTQSEINIYEGFIDGIEKKNLDLVNKYYEELTTSVMSTIRKDLGMKPRTLKHHT